LTPVFCLAKVSEVARVTLPVECLRLGVVKYGAVAAVFRVVALIERNLSGSRGLIGIADDGAGNAI